MEERDEDMWEQEPVEIESRPNGKSVLSLRMSKELMHALEADANRRGEKISEYVREAIALRLRKTRPPSTVSIRSQTWSATKLLGGVEVKVFVKVFTENVSADLTRVDIEVC